MKKQSQKGFAHPGLLLLLLVVAIIALVGYKVANHQSTTPSTAVAQNVGEIKTTADLEKAKTTLNSVNIDSDLNPSSLNKDVNSLL
jgi:Tfp pilus assembly protein PilX